MVMMMSDDDTLTVKSRGSTLHQEKREITAFFDLTYPSATKNSPLLSTATDVGLQNRELPEPGTSLSPNANKRLVLLPKGENLNTCNRRSTS